MRRKKRFGSLSTISGSVFSLFLSISTFENSIDTGERYAIVMHVSSVHRQPGRSNWYCAYTDHVGKRHFKTTGTTNKKEAESICHRLQATADMARSGRLTSDRARKIIEGAVAEMLEASGEKLENSTVGEFLEDWLVKKEPEISPSTFGSFQAITRNFLEFLGPRKNASMAALRVSDIQDYRAHLAKRFSSGSVNNHLKMLRLALNVAVARNLIDRNPAEFVENLARDDKHNRRPFTDEELKKLLATAKGDWKTAVACALYSGQRLGDVANLEWGQVDLGREEIALQTQKTNRHVNIPIPIPLLRHLKKLPQGKPDEPVMPDLHGKPSGQLSNLFYTLMIEAGLVAPRKDREKVARNGERRTASPLSFHCLRHSTTTLLKSAGVPDTIARDILGHDSVAASRGYTHISAETKREALKTIPDLL